MLDLFWAMLWFFLFFIWIWLLIKIFVDIFRADSSGWAKAGWTIFVVVLPLLGVLVYLIVEGRNMAERDMQSAADMEQAQRQYIQSVAGQSSAADQIEKLSQLHAQGVLSDDEFASQKAKLLA